ncbi:stimulator of interferon genes protein [Parasteatoda tepidariorum]|uniref:stimulator of interferon genes protein n=1 Tax=Parasteatoda tepidariorum TaxID=114398 RepID=UPI001C718C62|nr:stimulator of interferon genes protein-like [Parasteatoda tepidariorum]
MNLIVIGGYFYKVPQELILLLFTFLVIFFHRLFYKPSLTESENLIIDNDLSLGYGSALCYYDNYLNYILRHPHVDLKHRIRMFKSRHSIKNMSDKLFILIPSSCKVETYIDEFDCINRCKELIPVEINIAGISKRTFNISVYHIICDDDVQNSVRLALEYAQPLKVLFSLKEKGLLSIEDMHKQREIFTKLLKKKLSDSGSSELVHLIEYDDFPSQELFEVLLKVEAVHEFRKYKS